MLKRKSDGESSILLRRRALRCDNKENIPKSQNCFVKYKQNSQMTFMSLPEEVYLEIFNYLNASDLYNLTLVNPAINSIISNNFQLSRKFTLKFDQNFNNRVWIGSRKYSALRIKEEKGIFGILKSIGSDLKILTIDIRSVDLFKISRILSLCNNLKFIKFIDVKTHSSLDLLKNKELPKLNDVEVRKSFNFKVNDLTNNFPHFRSGLRTQHPTSLSSLNSSTFVSSPSSHQVIYQTLTHATAQAIVELSLRNS